MITFKDVSVLDRNSEYFGVKTITLMENAGRGVYEVIKKEYKPKGKTVVFFCGTGNNGGDGFVAARYLFEKIRDCRVVVVLMGDPNKIRTEISQENYLALDQMIPRLVVEKDKKELKLLIKKCDIIVDGMLGAGSKGGLREPYLSTVKLINSSKKPVVAIDVPTGLGTRTQIKADHTVTFVSRKEEMKGQDCGKVIVKKIGIPKEAFDHAGPGSMNYYNFPDIDVHKGGRGKVLVIGGGPYTGAPFLAGMAALRSGIDLVWVLAPKNAVTTIARYSPNLIVRGLGEEGGPDRLTPRHVPEALEWAKKVDGVVLGPGMGDHPESLEFVRRFVAKVKKPLVIDADALKALGKGQKFPKKVILTPHKGEMDKLRKGFGFNQGKPARMASSLSRKTGAVVILKGPVDVIAGPKEIMLNQTGNPGMAVGGTGDVLSGLCGGMLVNIKEPFKAACCGAFLAGYFGDKAFGKKGNSLVATDILDEIVIKREEIDSIPPV